MDQPAPEWLDNELGELTMPTILLDPGDTFVHEKVVGTYEVRQFAESTGDFARTHLDEAFMRDSSFGGCIVHGVLILGLASAAATLAVEASGCQGVSYGYDRVRFVAPVLHGAHIRVAYEISEVDHVTRLTRAKVTATTGDGTLCLVAEHLMKFLDPVVAEA